MAKWKIQRKLYGIDNWDESEDCELYTNYQEALSEIREFIKDCENAYHQGFMSDYPAFEDFRIKKVEWENH